MRRAVRCGMLAGALAAVSPAARADDAAAERDAQTRFEEGIARVKAGNFEGARMSFTQAYAVLHKPTILWNLALAEEKTGNVLTALGHFKEFAHGMQVGDDRAGAEKHIADLMGQTGHVDVAAPAGTQVIVDGAPTGIAPLGDAVDVMPGRHRFEVHTAQGGKEADAEVAAGQLVHVGLVPPVETARPGAAPAPLAATSAHSANPLMSPVATALAASGDGTATTKGSSTSRVVAVALQGTLAVVSIGLGAYSGLQSQSDASTADGFRGQYGINYCYQIGSANSAVCKQWNDARQAQGRDATLSSVFYVAGGVLAVGAVSTWFLWPRGSTSLAAHLLPSLGMTGAALNAAGSF